MTKVSDFPSVSKFHLKRELKTLSGTYEIEVGPELAACWLGFNEKNRPLSMGHVHDYVGRMDRGEWCLNGQALIFSKSGALLDGQHRLQAVVQHGGVVSFDVRFGVDPAYFSTLDDGRKRTLGDNLSLTGVSNHNNVGAAVKKIAFLDREHGGNKYGLGTNLSNSGLLEWYFKHPHVSEYVSLGQKWYDLSDRLLTVSEFASHAFMMGQIDENAAEAFMGKLALGANLPVNSPIFKLRARLLQFKMLKNQNMDQVYRRALIIKAWNHYRSGSKVVQLKYDQNREPTPTYE